MATRKHQVTISKTPSEDAERLKGLMWRTRCSQSEFAEANGIGSQAQLWQFLNPEHKKGRPLNLAAAIGFAKGLGVSVEEFSPSLQAYINFVAGFACTQGACVKKVAEPPAPIYLKTQTVKDDAIDELVAIAKAMDSVGVGMLIERARAIAEERPVSKTAGSST